MLSRVARVQAITARVAPIVAPAQAQAARSLSTSTATAMPRVARPAGRAMAPQPRARSGVVMIQASRLASYVRAKPHINTGTIGEFDRAGSLEWRIDLTIYSQATSTTARPP